MRIVQAALDSRLWRALGHLGTVQMLLTFAGACIGTGGAFAVIGQFWSALPLLSQVLFSCAAGLIVFALLIGLFTWIEQIRRPTTVADPALPLDTPTEEQRQLAIYKAKEDAAWRLQRLTGHRRMADEWIARCSAPDAATLSTEVQQNAYAALVALDRAVHETLADVPQDQGLYDDPLREENLGKIVWSGLRWHEHVAVMFRIRRDAISELHARTELRS